MSEDTKEFELPEVKEASKDKEPIQVSPAWIYARAEECGKLHDLLMQMSKEANSTTMQFAIKAMAKEALAISGAIGSPLGKPVDHFAKATRTGRD